ncbi:hypothetical protein [Mycoplasma todarodis]|uniref:Lipoprotein n=1 Tax=Mycoplasma todarodis TaxID=1937191 RepID=A0A4R0XNK2_9MOLU|nr:hypothetical protein [Mycoplasma todarodis]TCG11072.1 hypothetical protein C4B25_02385 [Mycoplasma todarodis]
MKTKRISMGILAVTTIALPVIATSCGKENEIRVEIKDNSVKIDKTIKPSRVVTLEINEKAYGGDIKSDKQLIRNILMPASPLTKTVNLKDIIINKNQLPNIIQYDEWTSLKRKEFDGKVHIEEVIKSIQQILEEATHKLDLLSEEILSIKEVKIKCRSKQTLNYVVEKQMLTLAKENLLETKELFRYKTSHEIKQIIAGLDISDESALEEFYRELNATKVYKKIQNIKKKMHFNNSRTTTLLNKLIHL